jgi:uncharacterized spore protein YtfJ
MLDEQQAVHTDGPRRRADTLIQTVVERIGGEFRAAKVFGEPVERGGTTVIPVAALRMGFGGGTNADASRRQDGEGAGGGGTMTAVGYIELKDGTSRFVPVMRLERMVVALLAAVLVGVTIGSRRTRNS